MPRKLTTAEFIEKAQAVHGNFYDYSGVKYQTAHKKVIIICPNHGKFKQIPSNHFRGHGCDKCQYDKRTTTTKEFIEKAQDIHGDQYDYSEVNYRHSKESVTIICPDHGKFKQRANNHLKGQGCPKCARKTSNGEFEVSRCLNHWKIKYQREWVIPKSNGKRFDFYLPDYNTFIEYDGKQHFTGWGGKLANLVKKQKNDQWKNEWAEKNDYNLIRVPYTEDVSEFLAAYFDV